MGKYDNIQPDTLRADLLNFASLIQRLEQENRLLHGIPRLLKLMGDLRQKLFAYEVRAVARLRPAAGEESTEVREARRIIEEALRRERQMIDEWQKPWSPDQQDQNDK
ncbi:MAG: hypothetical protein HY704_11660 [Gemmatimonadetes bacterium]|nr:hypothetical protein [Gemmatimonadota bacterium]